MTENTIVQANKIRREIEKLKEECKRIPRQYLHWNDKSAGYWRRMLVGMKNKLFVKYPQRYEGDTDILMELTEEDLTLLVDIRESRISKLEKELQEL